MEKVNYEIELEKIIAGLTYKPRLLLHSCCGPCSSYVITYLKDYFALTILYYNPNIEPKEEYLKRKQEQIKLIEKLNLPNVKMLDIDYLNEEFRSIVTNHEKDKEGGPRCHLCYELRLKKTMEVALTNDFEYFGTTLTVSPYKNAQVLNQIGERISEGKGIKWLYSDFKKKDGYKKSIILARKFDLYRQNYCGCLFSHEYLEKENETIKEETLVK